MCEYLLLLFCPLTYMTIGTTTETFILPGSSNKCQYTCDVTLSSATSVCHHQMQYGHPVFTPAKYHSDDKVQVLSRRAGTHRTNVPLINIIQPGKEICYVRKLEAEREKHRNSSQMGSGSEQTKVYFPFLLSIIISYLGDLLFTFLKQLYNRKREVPNNNESHINLFEV